MQLSTNLLILFTGFEHKKTKERSKHRVFCTLQEGVYNSNNMQRTHARAAIKAEVSEWVSSPQQAQLGPDPVCHQLPAWCCGLSGFWFYQHILCRFDFLLLNMTAVRFLVVFHQDQPNYDILSEVNTSSTKILFSSSITGNILCKHLPFSQTCHSCIFCTTCMRRRKSLILWAQRLTNTNKEQKHLTWQRKEGKTISVNVSFDCRDCRDAVGRFLLMSEYFRALLQILQPLLFD